MHACQLVLYQWGSDGTSRHREASVGGVTSTFNQNRLSGTSWIFQYMHHFIYDRLFFQIVFKWIASRFLVMFNYEIEFVNDLFMLKLQRT